MIIIFGKLFGLVMERKERKRQQVLLARCMMMRDKILPQIKERLVGDWRFLEQLVACCHDVNLPSLFTVQEIEYIYTKLDRCKKNFTACAKVLQDATDGAPSNADDAQGEVFQLIDQIIFLVESECIAIGIRELIDSRKQFIERVEWQMEEARLILVEVVSKITGSEEEVSFFYQNEEKRIASLEKRFAALDPGERIGEAGKIIVKELSIIGNALAQIKKGIDCF